MLAAKPALLELRFWSKDTTAFVWPAATRRPLVLSGPSDPSLGNGPEADGAGAPASTQQFLKAPASRKLNRGTAPKRVEGFAYLDVKLRDRVVSTLINFVCLELDPETPPNHLQPLPRSVAAQRGRPG